jgi:anti-sigma28 factor (negative regulator of flagellin synthesis)
MIQHCSTCLKGPKSRARRAWKKARGGEIRHDLVARVRKEIAEGTYDTPEKMQAALERLLSRQIG